jgi:hypothetical protein
MRRLVVALRPGHSLHLAQQVPVSKGGGQVGRGRGRGRGDAFVHGQGGEARRLAHAADHRTQLRRGGRLGLALVVSATATWRSGSGSGGGGSGEASVHTGTQGTGVGMHDAFHVRHCHTGVLVY